MNILKKYSGTLLLPFLLLAFAQQSLGAGDVCISSAGYTPPSYTAADILNPTTSPPSGFLAQYPVLAAQVASGNFSALFTTFHTDWYNETLERGLLELATIRGILDARNLKHMYLGAYTGNLDASTAASICGPETATARTADGRCNKLSDPLAGSVGTRLGRNVSTFYTLVNGQPVKIVDAETTTLMSPNPRDVSLAVLKRRSQAQEVPFLNLWATAWTQFMIHDWFDHGPSDNSRPISIPLGPKDPFRLESGQTQIVVGSTPADSSRLPSEASLPKSFNNYVTHWWDGSQLYGSDAATADRLRSHQGGKLALDQNGRLPINAQGFGDSGFSRNWWLGLEMLHTLFAQEHNSIADMLATNYPSMSDQELYDKARLINAALMAKIHTLEWTPGILPNKTLDVGMNANWYGLQKFVPDPVQKYILGLYAQGAIAAGALPASVINPVIYGIVGGNVDDKGVSFSMTEEFAAIYRMHPLTPDKLALRTANGTFLNNIAAVDSTNTGARTIMNANPFDGLAVSFGLQHPGQLVLRNYPKWMTELVTPAGKIDLAAIDLLRDRERGLPRYNMFRRLTNLPPVPSIDALTDDATLRKALKDVYPGGIEQVDLFVGVMAESFRPTCYGFSETLFQTFILMASRRLQADRFYTNDYRPGVYTQQGLDWVANNNFKSVLIRHIPSIAHTLENVQNAFKPWDDTPPTSP